MELGTNARGNLVIPVSRLRQVLGSLVLAFAATVAIDVVGGVEMQGSSPALFQAAVFALLAIVILVLFRFLEKEIEFDGAKQCVMRGNSVVAKYADIHHVEIQVGNAEDEHFVVILRLGEARQRLLFRTYNEAAASLNAAAISRAIYKPVQVRGR